MFVARRFLSCCWYVKIFLETSLIWILMSECSSLALPLLTRISWFVVGLFGSRGTQNFSVMKFSLRGWQLTRSRICWKWFIIIILRFLLSLSFVWFVGLTCMTIGLGSILMVVVLAIRVLVVWFVIAWASSSRAFWAHVVILQVFMLSFLQSLMVLLWRRTTVFATSFV